MSCPCGDLYVQGSAAKRGGGEGEGGRGRERGREGGREGEREQEGGRLNPNTLQALHTAGHLPDTQRALSLHTHNGPSPTQTGGPLPHTAPTHYGSGEQGGKEGGKEGDRLLGIYTSVLPLINTMQDENKVCLIERA